jgi:hypothetical protein
MKKFSLLISLIGLSFFSGSCFFGSGSKAKVYITTDSYGGTLTVVKFLEPAANSGTESNVYSEYTGTIVYNGWTWYIYEVSSGEYDVYVERTGTGENNGRARINLDAKSDLNEWAAVYFDESGNLWGEEGGGDFAPYLYNYP